MNRYDFLRAVARGAEPPDTPAGNEHVDDFLTVVAPGLAGSTPLWFCGFEPIIARPPGDGTVPPRPFAVRAARFFGPAVPMLAVWKALLAGDRPTLWVLVPGPGWVAWVRLLGCFPTTWFENIATDLAITIGHVKVVARLIDYHGVGPPCDAAASRPLVPAPGWKS